MVVAGDSAQVRGHCISLLMKCPGNYGGDDCSTCATGYIDATCSTRVYNNITLTSFPEGVRVKLYEGEKYTIPATYSRSTKVATSLPLYLVPKSGAVFTEIASMDVSGYNGKGELEVELSESTLYSLVSSRGYYWQEVASTISSYFHDSTVSQMVYNPTSDVLFVGVPGSGSQGSGAYVRMLHRYTEYNMTDYSLSGTISMSSGYGSKFGWAFAVAKDLSRMIICDPYLQSSYPLCYVYTAYASYQPYETYYWSYTTSFSNK